MSPTPGYSDALRVTRLREADELEEMATKIMPLELVHSMPEAIHRLQASAMVRVAAIMLRESPS